MKIAATVLFPILLHAQPMPSWKMVHSLDSDKNDRISRKEFLSSDAIFDNIDANKDGFLTKAEVVAAQKTAKPTQELSAIDLKTGQAVNLRKLPKPTALIFGTHTWRPFVKQTVRLQKIYEAYGDQVQFYWVYAQEARASDTGLNDSNDPTTLEPVANHRTMKERIAAAKICAEKTSFEVPILVDDMDNTVTTAFQAHPTRLFLLNPDGSIAFHGKPGPFGTDLGAFEKAVKAQSRTHWKKLTDIDKSRWRNRPPLLIGHLDKQHHLK